MTLMTSGVIQWQLWRPFHKTSSKIVLKGGLGAGIGAKLPKGSTLKATTVVFSNEVCSTFTAMQAIRNFKKNTLHPISTYEAGVNNLPFPCVIYRNSINVLEFNFTHTFRAWHAFLKCKNDSKKIFAANMCAVADTHEWGMPQKLIVKNPYNF